MIPNLSKTALPLFCLYLLASLTGGVAAPEPDPKQTTVWDLARSQASHQRFSTLFTAHDVRGYLSDPEKLRAAIDWCKKTGVTKVYLESFRDGYQAEKTTLRNAAQQFRDAGMVVSGCVTPTKVGKSSTGWKETISCYTDEPTQAGIQAIFEFTATLFDEIMIDDFWFTDCACSECEAARKAKQVKVGDKTFPVSGESWSDYRCELMLQVSNLRVLEPAKRVNPKASLIIKYPQWYDNFHVRGYDVLRETAAFDQTWVGTETRDYKDPRWGGTVQYEAYFIMRWLGGIGGAKCGGGWFDPLGTTEATYVEQARQTILAGARESMLFCYGALQRDTGPKNIETFRTHIPELLRVAREVHSRDVVGIAAYKPGNSDPGKEARVFDFVGMLGFPLVPCHEFPADAPAAFFSVHALKDKDLAAKLEKFIAAGKPVLMTDGLAPELKSKVDLAKVRILPVSGNPKSLLDLPVSEVRALRQEMLPPFKSSLEGPNRVAFYLFKDGSRVIENFNDEPVKVTLNGKSIQVPARSWNCDWKPARHR